MTFIRRQILLILFAVVFVLASGACSGQLVDLDDFYGDLDGIQNKPVLAGKNLALSALLAKAPEGEPDAYLVVNANIEKNWHLYSLTQPRGGPMRGKFNVAESDKFKLLSPLRTASDMHIEISNLFDGLRVESHLDNASWIAPIKLAEGVILDDLVVSGTFSGQVCFEGEGGTCVPINNEPFQAVWDPAFDVSALNKLLKKADEVAPAAPPAAAAQQTPPQETQQTPQEPPQKPEDVKPVSDHFLEQEFVPQETEKVDSLAWVLLWAFLGGLILNVMPCVLPVIGLKILSFFEQAGKSRVHAFALNVWYTCGILAVFFALAFLSLGLNQMFKHDLFNIIMLCVVFAMALSLMDVWELQLPGFLGGGKSVELMEKEGAVGAFFKGIITTLLAIPCGAPFLSPALVWADTQIRSGATFNVFIAYSFIGLGLASPFLLIGAFPELLRFLPKPGMWMVTFKKIMGYVLLVAVVWILTYLPFASVAPMIAVLSGLWFACWFIGRVPITAPFKERSKAWAIALVVLFLVAFGSFDILGISNPYTLQHEMQSRLDREKEAYLNQWMSQMSSPRTELLAGSQEQEIRDEEKKHWSGFTTKKLEEAITEGKPVLIDFTADWCLSCKYFEKTVLHTEEIESLLEQKGIVSLQADCTTDEMEGSVFLKKLGGGSSVPVLALFTPETQNTPRVIRGGFYKKTVVDLINGVK